jgi:phosphoribosylformylglycinamidine synthase
LRHAIPPTLLISAIGIIEDVNHAVTTDLKDSGNLIYLVGALPGEAHPVPRLPARSPVVYASLHRAMQAGLVRACHDLSEGGLAVAAAEMCIGGRLGMALDVRSLKEFGLFAEANGLLLTEVRPTDCAAFESCFTEDVPLRLGSVTSDRILSVSKSTLPVLSLNLDTLRAAWQGDAQ